MTSEVRYTTIYTLTDFNDSYVIIHYPRIFVNTKTNTNTDPTRKSLVVLD